MVDDIRGIALFFFTSENPIDKWAWAQAYRQPALLFTLTPNSSSVALFFRT